MVQAVAAANHELCHTVNHPTTRQGPTLLEEKTMYQFMGEVEHPQGGGGGGGNSSEAGGGGGGGGGGGARVTVKARIARPMPGLDLALFEKALAVRRGYLTELLAA
jgi:hypothetical protein